MTKVPSLPKFFRQTDAGSRLEQFSTEKDATIHGILWVKCASTEHLFYPMFIYHNLHIETPEEFAGLADRVLCANFCDCHEPGGVNIAHSIDEFRERPNQDAVFISYPEDVVLHFFHKMTVDECHTYGKPLMREPSVAVPE